jgi:hypothetical protein
MSYGAGRAESFKRTGAIVNRIPGGTKPAERAGKSGSGDPVKPFWDFKDRNREAILPNVPALADKVIQ